MGLKVTTYGHYRIYASRSFRFGFAGYVVSDWGATHDSAADNANAGLDMEQPGDYIVIGERWYSRSP